MPAQWTGRIVGEMHLNDITGKVLAAELDWNEKYLSQVLNSPTPPKKAEEKIENAMRSIVKRRGDNWIAIPDTPTS